MFDQQSNLDVTRSAAIDIRMSTSGEQLSAWAEIADDCAGQDVELCIEIIKSKGLAKLNFDYQFDIVGSDDSNKLVKRASDGQLESIKQRLNWDATLAELKNGPVR